jgi:hypothetical protein
MDATSYLPSSKEQCFFRHIKGLVKGEFYKVPILTSIIVRHLLPQTASSLLPPMVMDGENIRGFKEGTTQGESRR